MYVPEDENECFIGIYLPECIKSNLEANNPTIKLDDTNINSTCTLIEELSHFHLFVNRAKQNRTTKKVEFEWQAEIDKLLICAQILKSQTNDFHFYSLFKQIHFNYSLENEGMHYEEANTYAGKFWKNLMVTLNNKVCLQTIRSKVNELYPLNWENKITQINSMSRSLKRVI